MNSGDNDHDDNFWPVEDSGLVRVVLGPNDENPYRKGRIRLLFVELYWAGMIVTWLVDSIPNEVGEEILRRPDVIKELEAEVRRETDRWADLPAHVRAHNLEFHRRDILRSRLQPRIHHAKDEFGNRYRQKMRFSQGTRSIRGTTHLTPGLVSDAHRLTITIGEARFTLDL